MEQNKRIYFAVKAFIVNKNKFLAMHKELEEKDIWELPGGRMEFGETAEETLKREVIEETGLEVYPIRILDTWNYIATNYQITGIIYLCKGNNGQVKLSNEHDNYKWLNIDVESIKYMHKVFKEKMANWNWNDINLKSEN